jgi:hypothetical protein
MLIVKDLHCAGSIRVQHERGNFYLIGGASMSLTASLSKCIPFVPSWAASFLPEIGASVNVFLTSHYSQCGWPGPGSFEENPIFMGKLYASIGGFLFSASAELNANLYVGVKCSSMQKAGYLPSTIYVGGNAAVVLSKTVWGMRSSTTILLEPSRSVASVCNANSGGWLLDGGKVSVGNNGASYLFFNTNRGTCRR